MNDDVRRERPPERLVRERHRLLEVLDGIGAADACLPQQGAERLLAERGIVRIGIDVGHDRPRELVGRRVADPEHAGTSVEQAVVASRRRRDTRRAGDARAR